MYFAKPRRKEPDPPVDVAGCGLTVVHEYKYLGVIIYSKLAFKSQARKVTNKIKLSLGTFRQIQNNLTLEEAKAYFSSMIMSRIRYCMTTWSQISKKTLQSVKRVYKPIT